MNVIARTAIRVGNSVAVTLPNDFVEAGDKLEIVRYDGEITVRPSRISRRRTATNEEVYLKFQELEKRYGKLYDDLARIP
jgi:virulence-associated protein VagC